VLHVRGANRGNWHVSQFAQAGGTVVKILHYPPHVLKVVMHVGSEADTLTRFMPESFLEEAEQAAQTRNCEDQHAAELTEDLLPVIGSSTGLAARKLVNNTNKAQRRSSRTPTRRSVRCWRTSRVCWTLSSIQPTKIVFRVCHQ
jgi:hypothetical protein